MTLAFKDASDFVGRTVNQNLINQVVNMDRYAGVNDINVANHANAFNRQATGAEVWYYAGDPIGKAIAEKVSAAIAGALGIVNRGAKPTTNLYVVSQSVGHTILIEWFFIDNASDVAKWQANKNKAIAAVMKVFESYPQYNFKTTHGGHYGENMMDPGAVGNGLKEAVVMQEVNKAILNYKTGGTSVTPNPGTGNQGGSNSAAQKPTSYVKGDKVVISPTAKNPLTTPARHFSRAEFKTTWTVESRNGLTLILKDNNSNGKLTVKDTDVVYMPTNDIGFMDTVRIKQGVNNWRGGKVMSQGAKNATYSVRIRDGRNLFIDDSFGNEGWVMDSQVERIK